MVCVRGQFFEGFDREREPPTMIPVCRLVQAFFRIPVILNYSKEVPRLLAVPFSAFVVSSCQAKQETKNYAADVW
jgi:hypothetical protein